LPVSRNWLVADNESVYFGQNLFMPFLWRIIVHYTCPILDGKGFMYICLSSSTGVKGFRSFAINASKSYLLSSVRGFYGTIEG
jgi:hypothetical protein